MPPLLTSMVISSASTRSAVAETLRVKVLVRIFPGMTSLSAVTPSGGLTKLTLASSKERSTPVKG